ncbi:MAG: molecular chaperone TorD family protein [Deltaproteobacteria bacterium]|nr:molecular chaperone TorD family protein [Deltaproteobacteria bacterium]
MAEESLAKARTRIYRFLAFLYHDEIPQTLIEKMAGEPFQRSLHEFLDTCPLADLKPGIKNMGTYVEEQAPEKAYKALAYEYADIFLNAGANPVFPYESVYVSRDPVVMGEPIFSVRRAYRKGEVHKSDSYWDLDDHIGTRHGLSETAGGVLEGPSHGVGHRILRRP